MSSIKQSTNGFTYTVTQYAAAAKSFSRVQLCATP